MRVGDRSRDSRLNVVGELDHLTNEDIFNLTK